MRRFEVLLRDMAATTIEGADVYQQEGTMTTFFQLGDGREVVDCWSERVASVRTADVLLIRRLGDDEVAAAGPSSLRVVG